MELMKALARKSYFLISPRQTGESTLIRETLPPGTPIYNFLDQRLWLDLNAHPSRMREELEAEELRDAIVVVDEIEKLPAPLQVNRASQGARAR